MKRKPVISTTFSAVGYDAQRKILEAVFRDGDIYQYFQVPKGLWLRFMLAPSKGGFFARHIRDVFEYRKTGNIRGGEALVNMSGADNRMAEAGDEDE